MSLDKEALKLFFSIELLEHFELVEFLPLTGQKS